MQRILGSVLALVVLVAAISLSVFVFLGVIALGAGAWLFFAARRYLTEKGILNPTPGVAPSEADAPITIIDGDFERLPEDSNTPRA